MKKTTLFMALAALTFSLQGIAQGTCATATDLTPGIQQCANTSEGGDTFDNNICLGNYDGGDDYLFKYTATATGDIMTLDLYPTAGATWTGISISQGCPEGGGGICMGVSTSNSGYKNVISDPLIAGVTYYIHVSTYPSPQSMAFCLDSHVAPPPPPPVNNACADAITIVDGDAIIGNTALATNVENFPGCVYGGGGGLCSTGGFGPTDFTAGVWYKYTSLVAGETVSVGTDNVGTNFDTEIQVYTGNCDQLNCFGGDDDGGDGTGNYFDSRFCWETSGAGVDYYIYVDGHGGFTGNYNLTLDVITPDECITAQPLDLGVMLTSTNNGASSSTDAPACNDNNRVDVWFSINTGTVTELDLTVGVDGFFQIWEGSDCATMAHLPGGCGAYTAQDIPVLAQTDYYIQVWTDDSTSRGTGDFDIIISDAVLSVANDNVIDGFSMYPNPVNDVLNLKARNNIDEISIYNLMGQEILRTSPKNIQTEVNMENLQSGIYLVRVQVGEQLGSYRVIKK